MSCSLAALKSPKYSMMPLVGPKSLKSVIVEQFVIEQEALSLASEAAVNPKKKEVERTSGKKQSWSSNM